MRIAFRLSLARSVTCLARTPGWCCSVASCSSAAAASGSDAETGSESESGSENGDEDNEDQHEAAKPSPRRAAGAMLPTVRGDVLRGHKGALTVLEAQLERVGGDLRDASLQLVHLLQGESAAAAIKIAAKISSEREALISDLKTAEHQLTVDSHLSHLVDKVGSHFEQQSALAKATALEQTTAAQVFHV